MSVLKKVLIVAATVSLLFSCGCNTVPAVGRDLRVFGGVIEKTFEPLERSCRQAEVEEAARLVLKSETR